jgi:hypothetical protein
MFLSTWTAYHPSVEGSRSKAFWDKVTSSVFFIFAPESMVWVAVGDWCAAKKYRFAFPELAVQVRFERGLVCLSLLKIW